MRTIKNSDLSILGSSFDFSIMKKADQSKINTFGEAKNPFKNKRSSSFRRSFNKFVLETAKRHETREDQNRTSSACGSPNELYGKMKPELIDSEKALTPSRNSIATSD